MRNLRIWQGQRGIILVVVIGLLAALTMVAIQFVQVSNSSDHLKLLQLSKTRSHLLARSGFEHIYVELSHQDLNENNGSMRIRRSLGRGTFVENGDVYSSDYIDSNARININDGILAGDLELGGLYDANALNTFPVSPESEETVASAWINLRIRRLLNAYGEVVRKEAHQSSDPFVFMSRDAEDRGSSIPFDAGGLGDVIISRRPRQGYETLGAIAASVNEWGNHVGLDAESLGFDSGFSVVTNDFTVFAFEDREFFRLKDESVFGVYTNRVLSANDEDYARVDFKSLIEDPPALDDLFRPHSLSPININSASHRVRAAVFYAPANVSFPVLSAKTYKPHTVTTHYVDTPGMPYRQLPSYGAMMLPMIGVAGPCFSDVRLTESGLHYSSGLGRVQTNRLMSLSDAMGLAEAYEDYLDEIATSITTLDGVRTFEDFTWFLKFHHSVWLGNNGHPHDLERAQPRGTPFDPSWDKGFFTQDYLERTLPHLLSSVRRLPRYLGAPQALISTLYESIDVRPGTIETERGMFTVEDFVIRSTLPKISFLPSGIFQVSSEGRISGGVESTQKISSSVELFKTRIHRTQLDFERLTALSPGVMGNTTSSVIKIGPESTSHRSGSGSQDPSPFMGFVGLSDLVEPPVSGGVSPRFYLNGDAEDFESNENVRLPTNPEGDPHLQPPFHATASFQFHNSSMEGGETSFFMDSHAGSDLSPFGGYLMDSRGHGLHGTPGSAKRFNDTLYWNLAHPSESTAVFQLGSSEDPPGRSLKRGLVSLWFRVPAGYHKVNQEVMSGSHPVQWNVRDPFYTLFSLTVWEQFKPLDVYGGGNFLMRPIEIKFGYVYDNSEGKGKLVGRYEHHNYTFNPEGAMSQFRWMMGGPAGYRSAPFFPFTQYPSFIDPVDEIFGPIGGEGGSGEGGAGGGGGVVYKDPSEIHFLGIPEAPLTSGPVDVEGWVRTGSRLLERTLTLEDLPENGPGTWHRASLEWDFRMNASPPSSLLRIHLHDGVHRDFGSETSLHDPSSNFQSMISFNTQNSLVLGETFNRHHFSNDSEWYPGWRLDSSVDNIRFYCESVPEVNLTAPFPRYDLDTSGGSGPVWVLKPSLMSDPGEFDGARLYSVGTRIYWPEDEWNNFPEVATYCSNGTHPTLMNHLRLPEGHPDNPPGNSIFFTAGNSELIYPDPKTVAFSFFPNPSSPAVLNDEFRIYCQYLRQRRHRGSHAAVMDSSNPDHFLLIPWIKEVSYRYQPQGYPRIRAWSISD